MAFDAEHVQHITYYLRTEIAEALGHKDTGNSKQNNASDEYTQADYPGILDTQLTQLSSSQRIIFITLVSILCVLSLCGNLCALHVNFHRKIRPFFRACLISLALSDLLTTAFLTVAYWGQFTAEYVQEWRIGSAMCSLVPFFTTAAILASSMTLVGIALDRYFAVMKAVISFWNPSVTFCVICMCCIWGAAIGIATPAFHVYNVMFVYILSRVDGIYNTTDSPVTRVPIPIFINPKPETTSLSEDAIRAVMRVPANSYDSVSSYVLVQEEQLASMCILDQKSIANYYMLVFFIIFVPCIFAFIWLNSVIANKLWTRRHKTTRKTPKKKENVKASSKQEKKLEGTPKKKLICNPKFLTSSIELLKTTANIEPVDQARDAETSKAPREYRKCQCRLAHSSTDTTMPSSTALAMGGGPLKIPATTATGNASANNNASANITTTTTTTTNNEREKRHIRMFAIILFMMAVFIFLRLPAWIFLIMRMYGSYSKASHWMLYFTFGILNFASCALNPLFYTFLAEAIQCVLFVKEKVYDDLCGLRQCRRRYRKRKSQLPPSPSCNYGGCESAAAVPLDVLKNGNGCFGGCNCCIWLQRNTLICNPAQQQQQQQQQVNQNLKQQVRQPQWHSSTSVVLAVNEQKKELQLTNSDKDEGVECSDASDNDDEGACDYCYHTHGLGIYTIFPPSLVSSCVTSQ